MNRDWRASRFTSVMTSECYARAKRRGGVERMNYLGNGNLKAGEKAGVSFLL